jgi:hypothetical protein
LAARVAAVPAPVAPLIDEAAEGEAAEWGRVDADGTVYVRVGESERPVGQYPGATPEEALRLYVRRYLDIKGQLALFESRLEALTQREMDQNLSTLKQAVSEPAAVGDLQALKDHLQRIRDKAAQIRARLEEERKAAREKALEDRGELVAKVEALAESDPERIQWRQATDQMRGLVEQWKTAQRDGPRVDREAEDELWKRLSKARAHFERRRRQFFTELEKQQGSAKAAKEALVAEAEKLAKSHDWGPTSRALRDLMDRWKEAGRTARRDDDALWARFRAAHDTFFDARDADRAVTDAEQKTNLEAKRAILEEAEKLVPVKDLAAAKATVRRLQDRWDEIGHVPRADIQSTEARMQAVEQAIREAEDSAWKRSNPETKARAEGAASQLEATIAALRAEIAVAEGAGDKKKAKTLAESLAAREAWLEQIQRAAEDYS